MIKTEKRILSPTAINTYMSCPRKFYFRYIKKYQTRPSIHLIRGQIVHKTLHQFNGNHPQNLCETSVEKICVELLGIFNEHWETAQKSLSALDLPEDEIASFHHESELMLLNFGNWLFNNGLSTPKLSETRLWSENLRAMGIIDAVHVMDDKVVLVDYKTSRHARITSDIMRQAALYALLYQDKYNKAPDAVWIHFLKDPGEPQTIPIDNEILHYGKTLIDSVHEKTTSYDEISYPCTCGGYCEREFIQA